MPTVYAKSLLHKKVNRYHRERQVSSYGTIYIICIHAVLKNVKHKICINMCGDLKATGFHKLIYLNAWFLVSRTVWEGFGGVALLEKGCHRR